MDLNSENPVSLSRLAHREAGYRSRRERDSTGDRSVDESGGESRAEVK